MISIILSFYPTSLLIRLPKLCQAISDKLLLRQNELQQAFKIFFASQLKNIGFHLIVTPPILPYPLLADKEKNALSLSETRDFRFFVLFKKY